MTRGTRGPRPSVAVVGAGMAGLAAAWRLHRAGVNVTVLERDPRVGGRVRTLDGQTCRAEAGALFLTNFYVQTLGLVTELGLQDELVQIKGGGAVLYDGRLYPVWPQTRLLHSRLISLGDRLALLRLGSTVVRHWHDLDLDALHKAHALDTHSVAQYARTQLNERILARLLAPALRGFLHSTPELTSQAMLLVLSKGGIVLRRLLTFRNGMGQLPDALAARLQVTCGAAVRCVMADPAGGYALVVAVEGAERRLAVDGVVCATTAQAVPELFPDLDPGHRAFFQAVRYAPAVTAAVDVPRRLPTDPHTVLFPQPTSPHLSLAAVESARHPGSLPDGKDLLLLHATAEGARELLDKGDTAIVGSLLADLRQAGPDYHLVGNEPAPFVQRWPEALPEFAVGHIRRLRQFALGDVEWGRVAFAGDYLHGPLIEGAVISGLQAADRLLARLEEPRRPWPA